MGAFAAKGDVIGAQTGRFGRGIAYATANPLHLLNTPAGNMSPLPEDVDHFVHWAAASLASTIAAPVLRWVMRRSTLGVTTRPATPQATSTSTVSVSRHDPPSSTAARRAAAAGARD